MPYPILTTTDAKRFLVALRAGESATAQPRIGTKEQGQEIDWEATVTRLRSALTRHRQGIGAILRLNRAGARFEAVASADVHRILPSRHPALSDPEFWTWLAATQLGDIVEWRYNRSNGADMKNYGIGAAAENLLYRLWLRAELAYDADSRVPYELATFGDIDFWRSHLFRQSYAFARQFARALLKFQFPDGRPRLKIREIRELAKRLRASRTNLLIELMDEARARRFIESEWSKLTTSTTDD